MIETYTATHLESLACFAMYGESSDDTETETAYDAWLESTMEHEGFQSMHLVSVGEGPSFMAYHELKDYGIGSGDCIEFVYHIERKPVFYSLKAPDGFHPVGPLSQDRNTIRDTLEDWPGHTMIKAVGGSDWKDCL